MQTLKVLFLFAISSLSALDWQPTYHIWNLGLALACDKPISHFPYTNFRLNDYAISPKDRTIWVDESFLLDFARLIFPTLTHPIVLVTNNHDLSVPYDYTDYPEVLAMLDSPNLLHWFTQNYHPVFPTPKLSPIPIGIDFHTIAIRAAWGEERQSPSKQEATLQEIIRTLPPTHERLLRVICDFHHSDSLGSSKLKYYYHETRTSIYERLKRHSYIDFTLPRMRRSDLWKLKGRYAFSISPPGAGMDCHRTWEDLALGLIVIVKTSPLDPLYEGLPVVIVRSWEEITLPNLAQWFETYGDAFTNPSYRERLTNAYWMEKIQRAAHN